MIVTKLRMFAAAAFAEVADARSWQAAPDRVLATILFTDLVGSTAKAVELGPRWAKTLADHNAVIGRELARFRGRTIDTAGDSFFASGFEGPARAIRCACAIRDAVTALGLAIRVGVHTGECDLIDNKLSGVAVHIGARVAAQAGEGEVLVSGTVKDLVVGSGITFTPCGVRELKGLGDWPLFAVTDADDHELAEANSSLQALLCTRGLSHFVSAALCRSSTSPEGCRRDPRTPSQDLTARGSMPPSRTPRLREGARAP
jgi:class 3 adenylate cyclase